MINDNDIKNLIYEIQDKKVMLDSDLAKLYGIETKRINETVNRNKEKFSEDVTFIVEDECILRSHCATSRFNTWGGRRNRIRVFSREGIEILSNILKSPTIKQTSVQIFQSFDSLQLPSISFKIEDLIYEIRGKQVMLDSDLALLYQCKNGTKSINQAIKRHENRFPEDFCFKLNEKDYSVFWSQIGTKKQRLETRGGKYKNAYAFTEQGVAMLATILRTSVAEEVSVNIMRAFVTMRKYISSNLLEQKFINNQVMKNTENIEKNSLEIKLLQDSFSKFEEKHITNEIYFNGQIYDAYSKLVDIMSEAQEKLIIIDGYADKSVLDMIANLNVSVTLIVKKKENLKELDLSKYNEQYHNLTVVYDNSFHDRYIIIDNKKIYHCGASINHAGSKTFSINVLEDEIVVNNLLKKVYQLVQEFI